MGEQGHREDALEQLELAGDFRVGEIEQSRRAPLGGEPAGQTLPGVEPHRLDDRPCQSAMGRDAIFLGVGVRQQQGHPGRPHEIADRVQKHLERAW